MQAGYFQPFDIQFKLAWIWWIVLLSIQRVLYYENNLQWNNFLIFLMVIIIAYFYFLVRQRRFFASKHHLYFTKDFRLRMLEIDLAYVSSVRLTQTRLAFSYAGKYYHFVIWGSSHKLLEELLEENGVEYKKMGQEKKA